MNQATYAVGTKVAGNYYGVNYTGVVAEAREHTVHRTRVEHTIQLDSPINVFSKPRDRVIVATNDVNEHCTIKRIAA